MSLQPASTGARAPRYGLLWMSLGALVAGALLGIWQPLVVVVVGGFGIAGGPTGLGLLFMLCVVLMLIVGVTAIFSRASRATTLPILAVSGLLSLGMIGGNSLASGLDIGFAQPKPVPTFVPSDPVGAGWTRSGNMLQARSEHSATLLADGRVLVVGGHAKSLSPLASAELYDPATGRWSATGSLLVPAAAHVAVLLDGGGVLVLSSATGQHDAEVWNPDTGTWAAVQEMAVLREAGFTATVLADGRVLVAGGRSRDAEEVFASAEIYDPGSDTWTMTAPMATARQLHTATLLRDGRVLVAGGISADSTELASAELYDPVSATWMGAASMETARLNHVAVTLDDGNVLVLGGADVVFPMPPAETFDVATGKWREVGRLDVSGVNATEAVMVGDGRVLAMGWMSEYKLYDLDAPIARNRPSGKAEHGTGYTATRLLNGKVLFAGGSVFGPRDGSGYMPSSEVLATAHLFDPNAAR